MQGAPSHVATMAYCKYGGISITGEWMDITPELYATVLARYHRYTTWHCVITAGGRPHYPICPAASLLCCPGRLGLSFVRSAAADKDNWMGISFTALLEHANCPLCEE